MNKRYTFMNILRILALAVIIGYHFLADIYQRGLCEIQHPDAHVVIGNINLVMVAVGIFFMLSGCGLVLMMKRKEAAEGLLPAGEGPDVYAEINVGANVGANFGTNVGVNVGVNVGTNVGVNEKSGIKVKGKWTTYYTSRFFKILIPFYITYIAYLVYKLITAEAPLFEGVEWWKFIFTVLGIDEYLNMTGVATFSLGIGEWFLGAIIMMYAVFPLIYTAMKKWKWQTIAAATVYYIIVVLTYQSDIAWYNNVFVKIYDFVLGMFLAFEFEDLQRIGMYGYKKKISCETGTIDSGDIYETESKKYVIPIILTLLVATAAFVVIKIDPAFSTILVCAGIFLLGFFIETAVGSTPSISKFFAVLCGYEYFVFLVHHCVIYLYQEPMQQARLIISKPKLIALFCVELVTMVLLAMAIKWIAGLLQPKKREK